MIAVGNKRQKTEDVVLNIDDLFSIADEECELKDSSMPSTIGRKAMVGVSTSTKMFKMPNFVTHLLSFLSDKDHASLLSCSVAIQLAGESSACWPPTRYLCPSRDAYPRSVLRPVSKMMLAHVVMSGQQIRTGSRNEDEVNRKPVRAGYPSTDTTNLSHLLHASRNTLRSLELRDIHFSSSQLSGMFEAEGWGNHLTNLTITESSMLVKSLCDVLDMAIERSSGVLIQSTFKIPKLKHLSVSRLGVKQACQLVKTFRSLTSLSLTLCEEKDRRIDYEQFGQDVDETWDEYRDRREKERKQMDVELSKQFCKLVSGLALESFCIDSQQFNFQMLSGPIRNTLTKLSLPDDEVSVDGGTLSMFTPNDRHHQDSKLDDSLSKCVKLKEVYLGRFCRNNANYFESLIKLPAVQKITLDCGLDSFDSTVFDSLVSIPTLTEFACPILWTKDKCKPIAAIRGGELSEHPSMDPESQIYKISPAGGYAALTLIHHSKRKRFY